MAESPDVEAVADFAVAVYREDGAWVVSPLPSKAVASLDGLVRVLRAQPGEGGSLGMVSIADDFFVAVRTRGGDEDFLLSDVTAAQDWPLAREVLERLDLPLPEDEDLDDVQPAGDLAIFEDLGLPPMEVASLCSDVELYPDEMLGSIASRLGFGEDFERVVDRALD